MCIRISENSKRKMLGGGGGGNNSYNHHGGNNRDDNKRGYQNMGSMSKSSSDNCDLDKDYHQNNKSRHRDIGYQDQHIRQDENRGYYKNQGMNQQIHNDPRMKQSMDDYGYEQDRARTAPYDNMQSRMSNQPQMNSISTNSQQSFLHNPLVNTGSSMKMKSMQMLAQDQQSINQMNSMAMHQNTHDNYMMSDSMQNQSMNEMMLMPSGDTNTGLSHIDQYILPQSTAPNIETQAMSTNPSYLFNNGVQPIQMDNIIMPSESNLGGRVPAQFSSMQANNESSMPEWGVATTGMTGQSSVSSQMESLLELCSSFNNILPIPKNATNTVYVEGIPADAKKREVARKSCLVFI